VGVPSRPPRLHTLGKERALERYEERVQAVREAICSDAVQRAWSILLETDYELTWDPGREAWLAGDGYVFYTSLSEAPEKP